MAVAFLAITVSSVSVAEAAGIVDRGASPPRVSKVSGSKVVASEVFARPASAADFWTKERMLSAQPVDNQPPASSFDVPDLAAEAGISAATGDFTPGNVTAFPQRIHGKIFFLVGANTFTCSGTIINSARKNVIFTAGHCVYDRTAGQFVNQLAFVPGYENGNAPLGVYYATQVFTTPQWVNNGANSYDIAVATLDTPIENSYGSRQIAFDLNPKGREYTLYGYPSKPDPPFNGEVLQGCRSKFSGRDGAGSGNISPYPLAASPCFMQQGASGGGWVTLGNFVNSVVSYGYCDSAPSSCGFIFGPYFSNAAKSLYVRSEVGGSPAPTVKLVKAPPKVVRKRTVRFSFSGTFSTLAAFSCKLDRQQAVNCSSKISITRLSPGKHTLRVRAVDQTGKMSRKQIVRSFRVILPRR
ncbi:MAG: Trypsin-like serine protease [Actinomycetota bacterium]|jgi:hypothetical protein|nr:Trypsin-like serine protease [Actinomycetota bacterium]